MEFASPYDLPPIEGYLKVDLGFVTLMGRSIAGLETVYTFPQWNLTIDTGRVPQFAFSQDHLALTHWHLDHAGGVANYLGFRCLNSMKPLKIFVPPLIFKEATEYLKALKAVCRSDIQYDLIKIEEGIFLQPKLSLRPVKSFHCTPSTGYLVVQHKSKLKTEYHGLSSDEIVGLKNQGVEIEDSAETVLLANSGDTHAGFFETEARFAKVLMMECSFFGDDKNNDSMTHYGHTHIQDWVKFADKIESEVVIMTHTSQRYSRKEVESCCRKKLPKSLLDRLVVFR